jgi:hypothetical protein
LQDVPELPDQFLQHIGVFKLVFVQPDPVRSASVRMPC